MRPPQVGKKHFDIPIRALILVALSTFALSFSLLSNNFAHATRQYQAGLSVTAVPSSVVTKVGEKASVNITSTLPGAFSDAQVCFGVAGFPTSGFKTSFTPECAKFQSGKTVAVLTIEVTPAAAPQTFTAYVTARSGGEAAQSPLSITVEPAMPAWVPWLGIVLFLVLIGMAAFGGPKFSIRQLRRSGKKRKAR